MNLPHRNIISSQKINLKRDFIYNQRITFKPNGLWIGIYDSWYNFWYCDKLKTRKDEYNILKDKYIYDVKLKDNIFTEERYYRKRKYNDKIFTVKNKEDVIYINNQYGIIDNNEIIFIDWVKFSRRYSGIEFINYIDIRKEVNKLQNSDEFLWFFSVDVDSICIWNLDLIEKIRLIKSI